MPAGWRRTSSRAAAAAVEMHAVFNLLDVLRTVLAALRHRAF